MSNEYEAMLSPTHAHTKTQTNAHTNTYTLARNPYVSKRSFHIVIYI